MLAALVLCLSNSPCAENPQAPAQTPFTQADLEALVVEIDKVVPHNEHYSYPIEPKLVATKEINAQAGPRMVKHGEDVVFEQRDGKWIPQVEMFQGLVDRAKGDKRILRAVLAHELAHLALGHTPETLNMAELEDVFIAHTRQQEFEADDYGSKFLVAMGYPVQDLVDTLMILDNVTHDALRDAPEAWLFQVTANHASAVTRAVRLTKDEGLLAAVTRFEIGLAYMGCRRYSEAIAFFDDAAARTSKLHEAVLDAASAALQDYYDRLPGAVQEEWLRPEFGPHLTDVVRLRGRGIEIGAADRERYAAALARIQKTRQDFQPPMKLFLLATARVLDPAGDEATIRSGVKGLQDLLVANPTGGWDAQLLRLRVANNIALGLQRLGEDKQAAQALLQEFRRAPQVLPSTIENLARLPLEPLAAEDALLVANLFYSYLSWTPASAPGSRAAERAVESLKKQHALSFKQEPVRPPVALCSVAVIAIDGHEVGLFQHFGKVSEILGTIPEGGPLNERLPDLKYLNWNGGDVVALMESEQLIKITSYRKDTALELRPAPGSGLREPFRVRVGMSEAELDHALLPAGGSAALLPQTMPLFGRAFLADPPKEELWRYYPQLEFGVLIENGVITGITVAPVPPPPSPESK